MPLRTCWPRVLVMMPWEAEVCPGVPPAVRPPHGRPTSCCLPSLEDWLKCAPTGEALVSNLCHVAVVADRQLPHFGNNFA